MQFNSPNSIAKTQSLASSLGGPSETMQPSPFYRGAANLNGELEATDKALTELYERLSPVLRPPQPQSGTANELAAEPPNSTITAVVTEAAYHVTRLRSGIEDILRRLDV